VVDPGTEGDGDVSVGPTYTKSPDLTAKASAGKNFNFTMNSADSKIFTGQDTTLNAPAAFTRRIDVHIPTKYQDGTPAPFMVVQDGAGGLYNDVRTAVDNLSQSTDLARRLPAFIVIAAANGGGDSLGSERGLEYDTMADRYARLIDEEVLPAILANASVKAAYPNLKFTDDPEGRGTVGCSSGGSAALIMGWFKPDRYRKIIGYSTTLVAQQDTDAPEGVMYPHGAWDFHSDLALIANTSSKPLRIFINANDADNGAGTGAGNRHDWLLANQRTAAALKAKNYHYRYLEGKGAGHCDAKVQDATVPDTLLWVWRGYPTGP
jgi:enterochelin esterase-like enzyme